MQEEKNKKYKFSDLGGKTDINDTTIIETAVREVMEETNTGLFSKLFKPEYNEEFKLDSEPTVEVYMENFSKLFTEHKPKLIYKYNCKYITMMTELDTKYINSNMLPNIDNDVTIILEFGEKEDGTELYRNIVWIEMEYFKQLLDYGETDDVHTRLKTRYIHKIIESSKPKKEEDKTLVKKQNKMK